MVIERFEFATSGQILFGAGTRKEIGPLARKLGRRVLLVLGIANQHSEELVESLDAQSLDVFRFMVEREPTIEIVQQGCQAAWEHDCDLVIGLGGGSALDAGKAIAALCTNPGDVFDYLEVVGRGKPLSNPPLPYLAAPTTAGTGAEVTRNAVLMSPQHQVKISLRSALMLPKYAIIDPELTYDLPPSITAYTGLDALTQVIEPYVSNAANPITDSLCREGISRAARSLQRAYEHGDDSAVRADMSLTSLFGGMALANAKLGAVHGFAAVLGGMFSGPHGAICARLLPHVMEVNIRALQERQPQALALQRYTEIARLITGAENATPSDGVRWVQKLCEALQVPSLSIYGLRRENFPIVIQQSEQASSMKGNPIRLTGVEMQEILNQAL